MRSFSSPTTFHSSEGPSAETANMAAQGPTDMTALLKERLKPAILQSQVQRQHLLLECPEIIKNEDHRSGEVRGERPDLLKLKRRPLEQK